MSANAPQPVILRIDDIGASSKLYEQYGRSPIHFGGHRLPIPYILNWGAIKRSSLFKTWGPYREMISDEWEEVFSILSKYNAKMTVCITACWVEADNTLVPFPEKFPDQAAILKQAANQGLIEIGNHGLTHCVVGQHLPQTWKSNRSLHREFWDWLPAEIITQHIKQSQEILTSYFGNVVTFTPPGNQWTEYTEEVAYKEGLRFLSARFPQNRPHHLKWADQHPVYAFHDRELVLEGTEWLEKLLQKIILANQQAATVQELYA